MTPFDHIWEYIKDFYYFVVSLQTLIAALIVLLGGRWVFKTEMKIYREKQKEKSGAIALTIQTKIQATLNELLTPTSVIKDRYEEEKDKRKFVKSACFLLDISSKKIAPETFFSNVEFFPDLFHLEFEKKPVLLFFEFYQNFRTDLEIYKWNYSDLKDSQLSETEVLLHLGHCQFFLSSIDPVVKWGIQSLEVLSKITGYVPHNFNTIKKEYKGLKALLKKLENDLKEKPEIKKRKAKKGTV